MVRAIDKLAVNWFAGDMPTEQGSNGGNSGSSPAENAKVKVVGRVGQLPDFRMVPDKSNPQQDVLVGNFSLAEHPDRDTTVWHEVSVWGERARRLQEHVDAGDMRVGQEVEVVGTARRRERATKEGGTKTVNQIYAYNVTPVRRDTPEAGKSETTETENNGDTTSPNDLPTPPGSWGSSQ